METKEDSLAKRIEGKYVGLTYITPENYLVTMSGKVTEIALEGKGYSYFKMDPVMGYDEAGKYSIIKMKEELIHIIPPGALKEINEKLGRKGLEKLCEELNQEKNPQKPVGFQINGKLKESQDSPADQ